MDAAIEAGEAGLVRVVVVGGPLKLDLGGGTVFEFEMPGRDGVGAQATREEPASGE